MKSKSSTTFILIAVVVLIVLGGVYFFVIRDNSSTDINSAGLVSTQTGDQAGIIPLVTSEESATGNQVVMLLKNLSSIELNDALFKNPSFNLLQDGSIVLPPATNQGRRNPFIPYF